jgi:hypothetical protein
MISPEPVITRGTEEQLLLLLLLLLLLFWRDWSLNSGFTLVKQVLYYLSHTSSPFCSGNFGDGVSQIICLVWLQTLVLLTSSFQVAGVTGVSYQCLAAEQ